MPGRIDMARNGFIAVGADAGIPKEDRGEALTTFGIATPETVKGTQDYNGRNKATAANALFMQSNTARRGPRGEAAGLAMGGAPALRQNGRYRYLEAAATTDGDFEEFDATPIVNGRIGNPPDGTIAYVVNTTRHGNPETLALHSGGGGGDADLVAHHEGNSPPVLSSHVADITGDAINPARTAGLHTLMRVRSMLGSFCQGKTSSGPAVGPNSLFINATKSTGDHTGWFPATYSTHDALHSHEVSGNLRPATTYHLLGYTPEGRPMVPGANDCDTLFTRGDPKYDSPLEILDQDEPHPIALGVFNHRTWCMQDNSDDASHPFLCKRKPHLRRWHTPIPIVQKPSCFASRDTITVDSNDNPHRTFTPSPEVYAPTAFQGTGFRFLSRPNILRGKPAVPYNGKGAA